VQCFVPAKQLPSRTLSITTRVNLCLVDQRDISVAHEVTMIRLSHASDNKEVVRLLRRSSVPKET
jgi:hypothetical protein